MKNEKLVVEGAVTGDMSNENLNIDSHVFFGFNALNIIFSIVRKHIQKYTEEKKITRK